MLFLNIYTGIGNFIPVTDINWIHKVWVNLINEGQQETWKLQLLFCASCAKPPMSRNLDNVDLFSFCKSCKIFKSNFLKNTSLRLLLYRIQT